MNIFNSLVNFGYETLLTLIQLLPNPDPTKVLDINDQWDNVREYMITVNWIFPVNDLLFMVALIITIELSILTWYGIRWILAHLTNARIF